MAKAVFYIKDHVQDVGYRLFIISKILNSDLEGAAINTLDGRIKVLLEGEKEHILQFYEELKKEKPELAENPTAGKMEFNEALVVPKVMRSSQDLLVGQFQKSVGFLAGMNQKLDGGFTGINQNLNAGFSGVNQKLDSGFAGVRQELGSKLDSVDGKLEALPQRIAESLKNVLKPFLTRS